MTIKTRKIPKLRFPEFSDEWKGERLGYIGKPFNGLTGKTKEDFGKGKSYIQYTQIFENSRINVNNFALVCIRNNENQNVVKYGDIFFTTSSETPNEIAYSSVLLDNVDELYLNSFCFGYRLNSVDKLTPCFAQFLLKNKNFRRRVVRLAQGSTRYNISKIQLMKEIVNLPNIPEQTKIANFLTSVDTKIEQLSKKKKLLGNYKKGLMQKIFNQTIRFKADDGSDFPKWKEDRLGLLCKVSTGKLDANARIDDGKYRFYTCAKEYYKINEYEFDTDALIVSGNGANVGYIHHYQGKFNAYQRTYVLDKFGDNNIIFIKFVLDEYLHKRITKEKKDGNTPYILIGTLTDMKINIPSFLEQTKIANFLTSVDTKIEQIGKQLENTKQYKKALLQQMFV